MFHTLSSTRYSTFHLQKDARMFKDRLFKEHHDNHTQVPHLHIRGRPSYSLHEGEACVHIVLSPHCRTSINPDYKYCLCLVFTTAH